MDTTRDLDRVDPWQESFERSLARRGKRARVRTTGWSTRRRAGLRRLLVLVAAASLTLGVAVAKLTENNGGGLTLAHANVDGFRAPEGSSYANSGPALVNAARDGAAEAAECHPVAPPAGAIPYTGYVNPLARARLTPERIDQGVDYAGTGSLTTIGAARVTRVATSDTGWPGAFIAYRLLGGPDRGCTVYYAEGVQPVSGLRVGQTLSAGRPVATLIPGWSTGIEIGWGSGSQNKTYAALKGEWNADKDADSVPSAAGKSFSALISALGGPPGKVEG